MTARHGHHGTLTYARWKSMNQRVHNPRQENYARYGGRGITVCDRWKSFALFLEDMGECPADNMTLERVNNDLGYQPGNCKWLPKEEQSKNRSSCVLLTHNGITRNVTDWAAAIGIPANSYLGLMRQATHSHADRAAVARTLLGRGHAVDGDYLKTFRRKQA